MSRVQLNNEQRKEILVYHDENAITNRALSAWASGRFKFAVSEMTISRLLKRKEEYLHVSDDYNRHMKRARKALCPRVEDATFGWFCLLQERNLVITDALICEAAKSFYEWEPKVEGCDRTLTFSHGWVEGFKKRFSIRNYDARKLERRSPHPTADEARKKGASSSGCNLKTKFLGEVSGS